MNHAYIKSKIKFYLSIGGGRYNVLVEKCSHGELYSKIRIYITILEEAFSGKKMWWWSEVWDLNAPLKMKIIFWISLKKNILTCDNGLHRGWIYLDMG
jgi:hypothetical protein